MELRAFGMELKRSFSELFEVSAEKTPDKIAVVCGEQKCTYKKLNDKSNRLARKLRSEGVKPNSLVGIMVQRSIEMVVAILGVFKAGGAYLPIDPDYPEERKRYILDDSKIGIVLVKGPGLNSPGLKVKMLDLDSEASYGEDAYNLNCVNSISDLAYVIYTSGSTGNPKGAMIEHAGMLNHMQAKINDLGLNETSIVAQNASQCFDISVWQFLSALIVGGKTVIFPEEAVISPSKFVSKLIEEQVTVLEVVPSYLGLVIDYIKFKKKKLENLKYMIVTGETLKPGLVSMWFELFPEIVMVNAYGPTEASDDITHFFIHGKCDMEKIPIGKPIQNLNIYIVDEDSRLCSAGERGELWVSGIGVGRGYLNNPDKTKKVFAEDPFIGEKGVRLYKTGDIGAWLPDGNIEFFGRKDYQVKINGFRIELGEIEHELVKHPLIEEVVTVVVEDKQESSCLCSYVVSKSVIAAAEIKEYLAAKLPDYMVPYYIIHLDSLPLIDNGKVNRKALPVPKGAAKLR